MIKQILVKKNSHGLTVVSKLPVISDDKMDGLRKDVGKNVAESIVTSYQHNHPTMPVIFIISVVSSSGFSGLSSYGPHAHTQRLETNSQAQRFISLAAVRRGN